MARPLHIGLIGGIGVAATVVYYQRIAAQVAARGQVMKLTIAHCDSKTLVNNNLSGDRDAQAEIFASLIGELAGAGCDCATITSLGGHFCFAETVARSSLPLVSAITPLDAYFRRLGFHRVGLLGTASVMRTRVFGGLSDTETVVPEPSLDDVGRAYQEMAVSGICDDTSRAFFHNVGREMIEEQGADAVALVGTDLGLAFADMDPGYPVVDAVDPHVTALVGLATGETSLDHVVGEKGST